MKKTFSTTEVAEIIGIHPNTVRLYERIGFLTAPKRSKNNYRIYTDLHITECKIIRCALRSEVMQNGLRKKAIEIIKLCQALKFDVALKSVYEYREMLDDENKRCDDAINNVEQIIKMSENIDDKYLLKKQAAQKLNVTVETLRNWERNGLLLTKRKSNGYRIYDNLDMKRLSIIKALRSANYSLSAILRLLTSFNKTKNTSIDIELNYPSDATGVVTACDHLKEMIDNSISDALKLEKLILSLINNRCKT